MKKLIFLFALVLGFTLSAKSQSFVTMPLVLGDTAHNAVAVSKVINATSGYSAVGMKVFLNKISGTLAGTAKFQGGDGSDWDDIGSAFTITDVATQFKYFTQTGGTPYSQYRILVTGSGTMDAKVTVKYILKKFNQ
jgi:hypothetical protein